MAAHVVEFCASTIKHTERISVTIRQHPGQYAHLPRPLQPEKAMNKYYPVSNFWCATLGEYDTWVEPQKVRMA